MHIIEVIIDGFKSYSTKTTISDFDRHFNAITGLNGSGKSNILDAICFVLGITTLSHVRASNLQELVYKYGNAGINKASVTIIFDNTDKRYSPIGCEEYDQIIISRSIYQGKSKYYLNGYSVTQDNIKNLFQSVQLNISNPHFLIMQGKVTQVVNMKPLEILGLLEEAAGTSIYEIKKEAALKTIKKKENKLEEINKILAEEITPQLEKLIKDKQNYLTWKSRENEITRICKILAAMDYWMFEKTIDSRNDDLVQMKDYKENIRADLLKLVSYLNGLDSKISAIENNKLIDKNLKELENSFRDMNADIKQLRHKKENNLKNIDSGIKEINQLEIKNDKINIAIDNSSKQKKDMQSTLEIYEKEMDAKTKFLRELENNLQNWGKNSNAIESELFNLNKLIQETKNNINKSRAEMKNLSNQKEFLAEENNKKINSLNEFKKTISETKKHSKNLDKEIGMLKDELKSLEGNFDNLEESYQRQVQSKEIELNKLERAQSEILSRYASRVEIQFRDPENNFDRSRVKGRVIRLFSVNNERFCTALEQVAGGKMFNIVVDNENTSSLLLSRRCFDYGVIFIPNNKIQSKRIPDDKLRQVYELAGNDAKLAIDLISYDKQYEATMQFVFGTTFVCTSSDIARKLAYNDSIKVKCVNLDGDVFDPSGTMTGGAANRNNESVLMKVQELNHIQNNIREIKNYIGNARAEYDHNKEKANRYNEVRHKLENLNIQLNSMNEEAINKRIKGFENEISKGEEEINRVNDRIKQLSEWEVKYGSELKKLENEADEFKANGTNKEGYAKRIKAMKETLNELEKNISQVKKTINNVEFDIKNKNEEINRNLERYICFIF